MKPAPRTASQATRRQLLTSGLAAGVSTLLPGPASAQLEAPSAPSVPRELWLDLLQRVSDPVLTALSERRLRATMPVEAAPGQQASRAIGSPLEGLGRLLAGLAPWLELDPSPGETARETALRNLYRNRALAAIESAVDPSSPDYMRFGASGQTLVDSSFLALALLRAPRQLMAALTPTARRQLVTALISERTILPSFSNWLLFAALNEAALQALDAPWDRLRIDYALREHQSWYLGDGVYGDGPQFHADFYNSFVIHPYLLQLLEAVADAAPAWSAMHPDILARARRYAAIQERMISPTGQYPVLGRSITYRAGAFHLLADAARRHLLPEATTPQQVRGALTAVQQRTLSPPGTFSPTGWLQIGLAGHQPALGETYISTGSLYLCSAAWLPLGLPPADPFWSAPDHPWTQKAAWSGQNLPADHALS